MRMQVGPYCTVSVDAGPQAGVEVVRVGGELDAGTTDELWPLLRARIERAGHAVVVDLTEVSFFGSAGLKLLMDGWQAAREHQVGFAVAAAHEQVLKPLRITKVDGVVLVRVDVDHAAVAALLDRIAPDPAEY
ncbi:anti-anti-sigma factor [Lentzea xinjiangensis]|uniref:Anti-sigma factor antagonist n=1 Tax=Lentzea xinjiangensis TaxID=402600 RepID=A0A1H9WTP5_9PSEU|nr:STAS domain-containing protein [Lentzea xinjiangensis]SES37235.1 anti-anti-sigma factor [Lentzea xinjiangensis]